MKKNVVFISAIFALLAVSCQKDEVVNRIDNLYTAETVSDYCVISYSVDDVCYQESFANYQSYAVAIDSLVRLSQEGHRISIVRGNWTSLAAGAKDVVTYETKDEKAFTEWVMKMEKDGYSVTFYYYNGVYYGTASKKD